APDAVVFRDDPPTFLDVAPRVLGLVQIVGGQAGFLATKEERGNRLHLIFAEMEIGHAKRFGLRLDHALVVDFRLGKFVLEEALMVVPRVFCRALGQARAVFRIGDWLLATTLGSVGVQSEVEALGPLGFFVSELGADAALVFHARDFVAAGAAIVPYPLLAFVLQLRIVHKRRVGVG